LAVGEDVRRAQSRGEWPGVRRTLRFGFVGGAEWVGGRARDEDEFGGPRFGRGPRDGGAMRPPRAGGAIRPAAGVGWSLGVPRGASARCAEFMAGNWGGGMEA
jgi:hypothetical protein